MPIDRRTFLKALPLAVAPIEPAAASLVPAAPCGIVTKTIVARQKALTVQWATLWSPSVIVSHIRFDSDGRAQVRELDVDGVAAWDANQSRALRPEDPDQAARQG